MEPGQPPERSSRVILQNESNEPRDSEQRHEKRYNGPKFGYRSCFRNYYPLTRNWGHLRSSAIESSLLPSQKAVLAMSRAQFLAYLRCAPADRVQSKSISNRVRDKNGYGDGPSTRITTNNKDQLGNIGLVDKLLVGVCIFRLDRETLQPAVLLLRRSPRWWRRRVFTSAAGRQAAGEWELPGGKVEDDDFCISAAIERLVREKIGLRVTKIMVMLGSVRWRAELKVLRWPRGERDGTCGDSTEEDDEDDGDEDEDEDSESEDQTLIDSEDDMSVHMDWVDASATTSTATTVKGEEPEESTSAKGGKQQSQEQENPGPSGVHETGVLGRLIPLHSLSPSPSPSPSPTTLTPESASASVRASSLPPLSEAHDSDHEHRYDDNYNSDDAYQYAYDLDPDHDPSLEPAPLSLPARTATVTAPTVPTSPPPTVSTSRGEGEKIKTLRPRRNTASSTTLPTSLHSFYDNFRCGSTSISAANHTNATHHNDKKKKRRRRNAQAIPYKIVRKEHAQLNFGVLVDEHTDPNHLPGFLAKFYSGGSSGGGNNKSNHQSKMKQNKKGKKREEKKMYEHDALEWATCTRVAKMPMSEDLRRVVLEGLGWMGELTARAF
ncbi:hypothetical protein GGR55DRAFT_656494 [Xylaria sp. FL0064]|nr:hypothetical protein GGR55DRAFT_656494 [Xylaria sp. FL0064]